MVAAGQDSSDAASYAKSIQPLLARADNDDAALDVQRVKYEQMAVEQANGLRDKISQEIVLVEGYAQNLDGLDQQARLLVGEIAMKNFALVRDRLKSIVLRADVGIVYSKAGRIAMAIYVDGIPKVDYGPDNQGSLIISDLSKTIVERLATPARE